MSSGTNSGGNMLPPTQARELGKWCIDTSRQYTNKSNDNTAVEQFGQQVFQHVQGMTGNIAGSNISGQAQPGLSGGGSKQT